MTYFDDFMGEMPEDVPNESLFGEDMVEALFREDGREDVPPVLADLRSLVQEAREPGSDAELADCNAMALRMAEAIQASSIGSTDPIGGDDQGRIRMLGRRRIAKVAPVIAVAAAVVGGGGLAAAEGLASHTHAAPTPHLSGWPHGAIAGSAHFTSDNSKEGGGSSWHSAAPDTAHVVPAAFGKVTKVDGSTTAGTCGVAGASGTFTVVRPKSTTATAVSVSSATKYFARTRTAATFANLCVGDFAAARGTSASTGSLSATTVFVAVPDAFHHSVPAAFGKVTKVDGSTTAGTCGVAGASGTFTVVSPKSTTTTTVSVSATTKYFAKSKTSTPTFATLCIGDFAAARGTSASTGGLTASTVFVAVPQASHQDHAFPGAFGKVTKVDGTATTGTCGVAGASGTFTVVSPKSTTITTVSVSSTTKYFARAKTGATFANLCVGDFAAARGTSASTGSLSATTVFVATPGPYHPTGRPMHDSRHVGGPTQNRNQPDGSTQLASSQTHGWGTQQGTPQSSRPETQYSQAPSSHGDQPYSSQPGRSSDHSQQSRQPASGEGAAGYGSQGHSAQGHDSQGYGSPGQSAPSGYGSYGSGGQGGGGSQGGWQGSQGGHGH